VLIATLCQVYESNEVSKAVVELFKSEGQVLTLLNQFIYRELKKTCKMLYKVFLSVFLVQETTLFRTDSMTTRAIVNYLKSVATGYLQDVLGPYLNNMQQYSKGYEVGCHDNQHVKM
jgi:hypothetical protein